MLMCSGLRYTSDMTSTYLMSRSTLHCCRASHRIVSYRIRVIHSRVSWYYTGRSFIRVGVRLCVFSSRASHRSCNFPALFHLCLCSTSKRSGTERGRAGPNRSGLAAPLAFSGRIIHLEFHSLEPLEECVSL